MVRMFTCPNASGVAHRCPASGTGRRPQCRSSWRECGAGFRSSRAGGSAPAGPRDGAPPRSQGVRGGLARLRARARRSGKSSVMSSTSTNALADADHRGMQDEIGQIAEAQAIKRSAAPVITRLGTFAGRMEAESRKVPNPTASTTPVRPARPVPGDAIAQGEHDRHQQRDAAHVGRHDKASA